MIVPNFEEKPTFSFIHLAQRLTAFAKSRYETSLYPSEALVEYGIENKGRE